MNPVLAKAAALTVAVLGAGVAASLTLGARLADAQDAAQAQYQSGGSAGSVAHPGTSGQGSAGSVNQVPAPQPPQSQGGGFSAVAPPQGSTRAGHSRTRGS